jgi:P27 family predicted phage terminase small subunit
MNTTPDILSVSEPDWALVFSDEIELGAAARYWRAITIAMQDVGTLGPENEASVSRLITVYILYDRAMREVAENGAVIPPKKRSSRSIARVNPHFTALTKLSSEATALESALGVTPRSRGKVTPTARKASRTRAADRYLNVVK